MTSIKAINAAICEALGIETSGTSKVVITLEAAKAPKVEVTKLVLTADGISERLQSFKIVSEPVPEDVTTLADDSHKFSALPREVKQSND